MDVVVKTLGQRERESDMSGCLFCTHPTPEQHGLLAEGQGWIATRVDGPSQRHRNEERWRVIGHSLQRLQCGVEPSTSNLDLAPSQGEHSCEMLRRGGH